MPRPMIHLGFIVLAFALAPACGDPSKSIAKRTLDGSMAEDCQSEADCQVKVENQDANAGKTPPAKVILAKKPDGDIEAVNHEEPIEKPGETPPAKLDPACFFLDKNPYGLNIDLLNPSASPSPTEMLELGVGWLRIEYKSDQIVSDRFGLYIGKIREYRAQGIRVLMVIDYMSVTGKPYFEASGDEWASYLKRYVAGAEEISTFFGDEVDAWEIWNEPDFSKPGYNPRLPEAIFAKMLPQAAHALKKHSQSPVITGGLVSGHPPWLAEVVRLAGGESAFAEIDGISVHPYTKRPSPDFPNPTWGTGNMADLLKAYEDIFKIHKKQIWVSEIGHGNTLSSDADRMGYLRRTFELAADWQQARRMPALFWFGWSDVMEGSFGLLNANGTKKADYNQFQTIARAFTPKPLPAFCNQ